jgi:Frag1/DRAM/Sfk1 family
MVGNLASAAALVLEYMLIVRRRDFPPRTKKIVKVSFVMKLIYLLLEIIAAIAFVTEEALRKDVNLAAVLEYVNAILFAFFIFSFVIDLKRVPLKDATPPGHRPKGLEVTENGHEHK